MTDPKLKTKTLRLIFIAVLFLIAAAEYKFVTSLGTQEFSPLKTKKARQQDARLTKTALEKR